MADTSTKYIFYHYNPSIVAATIFVVLFALSACGHLFQLVKKRTWYFIPFVIGGIFEVVGYIGRVMSAKESPNWTTTPYIMQSLLLLLAPALFAASIYMILGRIIALTDGDTHSLIRAKWLTKIFVGGDVLSFLGQSTGGAMIAKAKSSADGKLGENIIVGGLGIQIIFFAFFIIVAAVFHYRISCYPTTRSQTVTVAWNRYLWILYTVSLLIMIRSIFRIAEYIMGGEGVLLQNEIYLYIFDATLMFLSTVVFNVYHPSSIVSRDVSHTLDSQDTEMEFVEYPPTSGPAKNSSRR